MTRPLRLMEVFVELADSLIDDFDVIDFLQRLSTRCVELLDITAAGILLVDRHGELQAVAASDEHTRLLELFALQNFQGPCVDCYRSGDARMNIDLTDPGTTAAWAPFAAQARGAGFQVTHAVPMRVRERVVGALNLFHTTRTRLADEDAALAQAMADIATIAIFQQRTLDRTSTENAQLQNALNIRIVIEQAKGIMAERWNTGVDPAFAALRAYARAHQVRLTDLSYAVIDGRLDTMLIPPPPPPAARPMALASDGRPVEEAGADGRGRRSWPYRATHRRPRPERPGEDR